jgi:Predicted integral membrane protein
VNVRRWRPPAIWAAFILLLTSVPGAAIPHVGFRLTDKVAHTTMYAIFAWLAARSMLRSGKPARYILLVVVGIAIFGAADEWHQQFIPGRSMELLDWIADTTGATLGAVTAMMVSLRERREA